MPGKESRHIGAPVLAKLFSLCSYAGLLVIGAPCYSPAVFMALTPGNLPGRVDDAAAAASWWAWLGYCGIFVAEAIFAMAGPWVTLYSWKPSDVVSHHLSVVIGGSGIVAAMLVAPEDFVVFAKTCPPIVAVVGACTFTCFNE